jgi:DNA-binding NarL/FixJ family response regulator
MRMAGLPFDACVVGLAGIGDPHQVAALLQEGPVVVCTPVEHWRHRATAWACGARAVLGLNTGAVPLADAVCDAVRHPSAIQAQLARALLDAVEHRRLDVPGYLTVLLGQVARGRNARRALAALGVSADAYEANLEELREALWREGMDVPDLTGIGPVPDPDTARAPVPPEAARLSDGERDVLELYGSGYSYAEIATRLRVSAYTVKSRVLKAMEKCEIPDGHADVRMIFALHVSGLHRRPELLQRRLRAIRARAASPAPGRDEASRPGSTAQLPHY